MNTQPEFYDIFDYYSLPFYQTTLGRICITCGLIAAILLLAYAIIVLRKKKALTPWQWAHKELLLLSIEKCTCKDDYKKIYFQMSRILKQYLAKRYSWATEDKTDDELVIYLEHKKFDAKLLEMLKHLVDGAQWIKFANEDVLRNQATKDHATALLIIQQTTPLDIKQSTSHV
ncbi:MAG: hypothetical protein WCT20_05710 [Candidatus Babeliales bacterium]|jgi:hypothetical protein